MTAENEAALIQGLSELPRIISDVLSDERHIDQVSQEMSLARDLLYLGRGRMFPIALEGALKLKEISYIHAEGYPAAEMKHGPIALIDRQMPVIFIAMRDHTFEKVVSNIEEVVARQGSVIAITDDEAEELKHLCDYIIRVPKTEAFLSPILVSVPLQLLAYHIAVLRGCNVDQPRNLAKSVTVE